MNCQTYPDIIACLPSSDFTTFDVRNGLQSMSMNNSIHYINEYTNFSQLKTHTNVIMNVNFDFYIWEESSIKFINKLSAFSCGRKVTILAYEDPTKTYFDMNKTHNLYKLNFINLPFYIPVTRFIVPTIKVKTRPILAYIHGRIGPDANIQRNRMQIFNMFYINGICKQKYLGEQNYRNVCIICKRGYFKECKNLMLNSEKKCKYPNQNSGNCLNESIHLSANSEFCFEPRSDTDIRSHFYVALSSLCIPVSVEPINRPIPWAWRKNLHFSRFALSFDPDCKPHTYNLTHYLLQFNIPIYRKNLEHYSQYYNYSSYLMKSLLMSQLKHKQYKITTSKSC